MGWASHRAVEKDLNHSPSSLLRVSETVQVFAVVGQGGGPGQLSCRQRTGMKT